jgi:hypothetical protein
MMKNVFLAGKSRRLYKLSICFVALRPSVLTYLQYTLCASVLARLASEHF